MRGDVVVAAHRVVLLDQDVAVGVGQQRAVGGVAEGDGVGGDLDRAAQQGLVGVGEHGRPPMVDAPAAARAVVIRWKDIVPDRMPAVACPGSGIRRSPGAAPSSGSEHAGCGKVAALPLSSFYSRPTGRNGCRHHRKSRCWSSAPDPSAAGWPPSCARPGCGSGGRGAGEPRRLVARVRGASPDAGDLRFARGRGADARGEPAAADLALRDGVLAPGLRGAADPFPFILLQPQAQTEEMLEEHLGRCGGEVLRGRRVIGRAAGAGPCGRARAARRRRAGGQRTVRRGLRRRAQHGARRPPASASAAPRTPCVSPAALVELADPPPPEQYMQGNEQGLLFADPAAGRPLRRLDHRPRGDGRR